MNSAICSILYSALSGPTSPAQLQKVGSKGIDGTPASARGNRLRPMSMVSETGKAVSVEVRPPLAIYERQTSVFLPDGARCS